MKLFVKLFAKLFGKKVSNSLITNDLETNAHQRHNLEDDFSTTITDDFVRVEHPGHKPEEIFWKDIEEIRLINTDKGPFAPDIWLVLTGDNSGCFIPHGSQGYERVYNIVSKYDGFSFENVIKSMSSAENEQFLLWKKEKKD